jgi:hypothetical protein
MTSDIGKHVPTSAFRASLEQEILRELRAGEPAYAPPSTRRPWRHRLRNVALIVLGLFVGLGAQMASAQVQESRQRSELEAAKQAEREMVVLRVMMARLAEERARREFEVGAASRQSLRDAEANASQAQVLFQVLESQLAEIRLTSRAPRDEIWAPLATERDFVRERLQMQAMVAQQRLAVAEAAATEAERGYEAGAVQGNVVKDAQLDAAERKMEFQVLAKRIMLRDQFLKEGLTPEQVTREVQRSELMFAIQYAQDRLKVAKEREASARDRFKGGATTELELKRAELEVLEVQLELRQLTERYRAMPAKGG